MSSIFVTIAVIVAVICIAAVSIKIAILYFLSKTAIKTIPNYANANTQLTIGRPDIDIPANSASKTTLKIKGPLENEPEFPEFVTNSGLEGATMERFLSNMAKEKPLRFSPQHIREFTRNFSTRLGSGGFGVVYKGAFPSGVRIAVKLLNSSLGKRLLDEQFMAEVSTIGRTYHINLVRLYGFCFDPSLQALVYEYMENGSLDNLLFNNNQNTSRNPNQQHSGRHQLGKLMEIAVGAAKAIAYLHEECEQRIIHYDIKPGNVLLDSNLNPKVADFGLAKLCNRDSVHVELSGMKGTPGYAAPEVWMPYPVTYKCDVYSFGMLLFEIVGRRRNCVDGGGGNSSREWLPEWVYNKVERNEVEEMLSAIVEEEVDGVGQVIRERVKRAAMVALWCVQYLPATRPKMSDVVRMLEGGVEVPTPPNPFAYLASNGWDGSSSHSLLSGGHDMIVDERAS